MEQIFYVEGKTGLAEINKALQKGGTVKMIVTAGAGECIYVEAYVVVAFPSKAQ